MSFWLPLLPSCHGQCYVACGGAAAAVAAAGAPDPEPALAHIVAAAAAPAPAAALREAGAVTAATHALMREGLGLGCALAVPPAGAAHACTGLGLDSGRARQAACQALAALCAGSARARAELCHVGVCPGHHFTLDLCLVQYEWLVSMAARTKLCRAGVSPRAAHFALGKAG